MAPHTPHDDVYDIAVSPEYETDGVVFALCRDMFLKSNDGGHTWQNIVRGLNNMWQYFTDTAQRFSLDVSATDKRTMFFASRGDGVYRSIDEGMSWSKVHVTKSDARVSIVAISPHSADRVLAASVSEGLFATTDGGAVWSQWLRTDAPITAVAYAPDHDGIVAVGDESGRLHLSSDSGATWQTTGLVEAGAIRSIALSPAFSSDQTILVGTASSGVLKSVDGGDFFMVKNVGLTDTSISSIAFSPDYGEDSRAWISTWSGGVFGCDDKGESWRPMSLGLTRNTQKYEERYAKRPHFGRIVAASGASSPEKRSLFLAGFDGFFASHDGGGTWTELETLPATLPISIAVSPNFAADASVAASSYINGAHLSEDRGDTWIPINKGLEERGFMQQKPDRFARLFGIAFSPAYNADETLLCSNWTTFLKSTDRGQSWARRVLKERIPLQQFVMSMSPAFGSDGSIFLGNRFGEIWMTRDGAATWTVVSKLDGQIRSFAISPTFANDQTLFAAAATGPDELFVSTDAGATWTATGPGSDTFTHLAISPAFGTDRTLFAATRRGLNVTRDAGASWSSVEHAAYGTRGNIEAVAVSPNFAVDGTVVVSVAGKGLYKSTDAGQTFAAVGADLLDRNVVFANIPNAVASPLAFSPDYANDATIFGYAPSGFFRSTDGGEHWTDITPTPSTHPMPARIVPTPKADHSEPVQLASVMAPIPPTPVATSRRFSLNRARRPSEIYAGVMRSVRSKLG